MKKTSNLITILVLFILPAMALWGSASAQALQQTPKAPAGVVLFVTPDGTGACTSWADACSLQAALALAVPTDEVWVQEGVYTPTPDTDRAATFSLKSGVALYGGFAGTETERTQRDWDNNVTTLSGNIGSVGDSSDNSYHVITCIGVDAAAVLDGFTITGGNANGEAVDSDGGGMYCSESSPTLANVIFSDNSAAYGGAIMGYGGNAVLVNVTFSGNAAAYGGAMFNYGSNLTLTDITFSGNAASDNGGGMYNYSSSLALVNAAFTENSATYGGAVYNLDSTSTLVSTLFAENSAAIEGGAMYNNTGSLTLVNAIISGNSAGTGGGVFNFASSPTLVNVTFSANLAILGGGIYNDGSSPAISNTILWGNLPEQIYNVNGSAPAISYSDIQDGCPAGAACTQAIYTDPQFVRNPSSGADETWGTPDDDYGDLHLQLTSPVIDAGDNDAVPVGVVTDLEGYPRFMDIASVPDTGNGTPPIVDMGAYEGRDVASPTVVSILRADISPTNADNVDYTVTFSEEVTGVDVSDFSLTLTDITGASVTAVSGGPVVFTVTVDTGNRDGTIRLDVPDTASITDMWDNPLAGLPYTDGEIYTIIKTSPLVLSILRADPSPTSAASVDFTIVFSENATEVDIADFSPFTTGSISGAAVTAVTGTGTTYTVTVSTGAGEGTLRLDVPETATIEDMSGNSLANLPYESGEAYTIDLTAPSVVSILLADPNPTGATIVSFTVTFSEDVSGLEAADFSPFTTGSISGAEVTDVSGSGAVYTVTVSIAGGTGSLRLDIPDTATITDPAGNPLGVLPYESGEAYTIVWRIHAPLLIKNTP